MEYACLREEGKRLVGHIFPDGRVPIRSMLPVKASIGGTIGAYYLVDWDELSDNQKEDIMQFLIETRGVPPEECDGCLNEFGMCVPIRVELVSMVYSDEMRKYT